jgi:precorrin-2 dehydrogenase/sirohydrochlorin ferrochelatase
MLRVEGRPCLVVGGGRVASRKAAALRGAGGHVTVVATDIGGDVVADVLIRRPFQPADAVGMWLVVVATDDGSVNRAATAAARDAGALVNRADEPASGDVDFTAVHRSGRVTVAVATDGSAPSVAVWLRDRVASWEGGRFAAVAEWAAVHRTPGSRLPASDIERIWDAATLAKEAGR